VKVAVRGSSIPVFEVIFTSSTIQYQEKSPVHLNLTFAAAFAPLAVVISMFCISGIVEVPCSVVPEYTETQAVPLNISTL